MSLVPVLLLIVLVVLGTYWYAHKDDDEDHF